jgi:hypothetical protein
MSPLVIGWLVAMLPRHVAGLSNSHLTLNRDGNGQDTKQQIS